MAVRIKAGTNFQLPVIIEDPDFNKISAIEFVFTQTENGDTLKSAYWSKDGESRSCSKTGANTILVQFTMADTYLFGQNKQFCMDTRIHYQNSEDNPYTKIVYLTMNNTLFKEGEVVS